MTDQPQSPVQPDISYYPDICKYRERRERRQREEKLDTVLASGIPSIIDSPAAWEGSIKENSELWLFHLSHDEIYEIDEAMATFQASNLPLSHVAQETFPLPKLREKLRAWSRDVHFGLGFVMIRGYPVQKLSPEQRVIVFAGVSSYIGSVRARQDEGGAAISHVTDLTGSHTGAIGNPAFTAGPQAMHTDPGEIIGMFCVGIAVDGGESRIASSTAIYNDLAAQRPDLLNTLADDWILDGFGGIPKFVKRPLLFVTSANQVVIQFVRRALTGFKDVPRSSDIPPISEAQAEALDTLHFKGLENSITIRFELGDFQFLNNLNLLHSRNGFRDGEDQKRHLLRIWLRDEEYGWSLPERLTETIQWRRLFELSPKEQWFPLEPQVKSEKFVQPVN